VGLRVVGSWVEGQRCRARAECGESLGMMSEPLLRNAPLTSGLDRLICAMTVLHGSTIFCAPYSLAHRPGRGGDV